MHKIFLLWSIFWCYNSPSMEGPGSTCSMQNIFSFLLSLQNQHWAAAALCMLVGRWTIPAFNGSYTTEGGHGRDFKFRCRWPHCAGERHTVMAIIGKSCSNRQSWRTEHVVVNIWHFLDSIQPLDMIITLKQWRERDIMTADYVRIQAWHTEWLNE